jgi:hypothetical protein
MHSLPGPGKMKAASAHHRPNKAEYQQNLQRAFDRHFIETHKSEAPKSETL